MTDKPSGQRRRPFAADNRPVLLSFLCLPSMLMTGAAPRRAVRKTSAMRAELEPCSFDGSSVHRIKMLASGEQAVASVGAAH